MQPVDRSIKQARRRWLIQSFLQSLGWALFAGAIVALVMVWAGKLGGWVIPAWAYQMLPGIAAVFALIWSIVGLPDRDAVGRLIDDRCHLKDRIGTSLYLHEQAKDHPFANAIHEDAQQAATEALGPRLNQAFGIRLTRIWAVMPGVVLLAALCGWLVSEDLLGLEAKRQEQRVAETQAQEAEAQRAQIRTVVNRPEVNTNVPDELSTLDHDQLLDQIASLQNQRITNPQVNRERQAMLDERLDELNQREERQRDLMDQMRSALSRLDSGHDDAPASEFEQAMRRGDFDAAQKALEELEERAENEELTETERQKAKEQLENMSEQLEEMAKESEESGQSAQQAIEEALQNAGVDPGTINQLAQDGLDPEAVKQAMEQAQQFQNMSPEEAKELADQLQDQLDQMQNSQQNQQMMQDLADALGDMAQNMGQSGKPKPGQGQQPSQGQGGMSMSDAAQQMQNNLSEMAEQQQKLEQMQQGQQGQGQGQPGQGQGPQGQGNNGKPGPGGGQGGQQWGNGSGGNPFGESTTLENMTVDQQSDAQFRAGRVLASWEQDGPMTASDAQVRFREVIQSSNEAYERAVVEDRVSARYHEAMRLYANRQSRRAAENNDE